MYEFTNKEDMMKFVDAFTAANANKPCTIPFGEVVDGMKKYYEVMGMTIDLVNLIREEAELKKHHRAYLHVREELEDTVKANSKRIKELQELQHHAEAYAKTKPIHDQLQHIKFKKRREQFQQDHEPELRRFYLAKRKLAGFREPFPIKDWQAECTELQAESEAAAAQANELWHEVRQLIAVQHLINTVLHQSHEHGNDQTR